MTTSLFKRLFPGKEAKNKSSDDRPIVDFQNVLDKKARSSTILYLHLTCDAPFAVEAQSDAVRALKSVNKLKGVDFKDEVALLEESIHRLIRRWVAALRVGLIKIDLDQVAHVVAIGVNTNPDSVVTPAEFSKALHEITSKHRDITSDGAGIVGYVFRRGDFVALDPLIADGAPSPDGVWVREALELLGCEVSKTTGTDDLGERTIMIVLTEHFPL